MGHFAVVDSVKITCPHCGKRGSFEGHLRGHEVACRHCGQPFFIQKHVHIPCPKCTYSLKIRPCLLGEMVSCKYCAHKFLVQLVPDRTAVLPASQATPPGGDAPVEFGVFDPSRAALSEELRQARGELQARAQESAEAVRRMQEAQALLDQSRAEALDLRTRLQEVDGLGSAIATLAEERDRLAAREAELEQALESMGMHHHAEVDRLLRELERARHGRPATHAEERSDDPDAPRGSASRRKDVAARRPASARPPAHPVPESRDDRPVGPAPASEIDPEGDSTPDVASRLAELQDRLRATASRLTQPKV